MPMTRMPILPSNIPHPLIVRLHLPYASMYWFDILALPSDNVEVDFSP
jgi:hypothetical protein